MRYATIISFVAGVLLTLICSLNWVTAAGSQWAVPQKAIMQHHLQPIGDVKGYGVPAERVWVRGEDGKAYRLSDVIKASFER